MEVWKAISGYEGLYEVSNIGRIRNLLSGRLLKQTPHCKTGYLRVNLFKCDAQKTFYVHRLVAKEFVSNPFGFCEVNHKDEDKSNNSSSNLEWCDRHYNTHYGTRNDRLCVYMRKSRAKLSEKDVEKIKGLRDNKSVREIAHMFGISTSQVYRICSGLNWRDIS